LNKLCHYQLSCKIQQTFYYNSIVRSHNNIHSSYYQFCDTQLSTLENLKLRGEALEQERESKAVELVIKYNELMKEPLSTTVKVYKENEFWRQPCNKHR
jgi:hypothetical protein